MISNSFVKVFKLFNKNDKHSCSYPRSIVGIKEYLAVQVNYTQRENESNTHASSLCVFASVTDTAQLRGGS